MYRILRCVAINQNYLQTRSKKMSLRKRVKELEMRITVQTLLNIESFNVLFDRVSELIDRVEALEKGKPCECKKENEDGLKNNDR